MRKGIYGWIWTGLIVALFFIGQARAQTYLHWDANGNIAGSTSQAEVNALQRMMDTYNGRTAPMPSSVSINGGLATMERAATLEVGAGSGMGAAVKVAVRDVVTSPVSSLGKGIVKVARLNPVGLATGIAGSMLLDAGIRYLNGQWIKDGVPAQAPNGVPWPAGSGYWQGATQAIVADTPEAACMRNLAYIGVTASFQRAVVSGTTAFCIVKPAGGNEYNGASVTKFNGCPASAPSVAGYCTPAGYVPPQDSAPATDAQLESAMTSQMVLHPNKAMDVLKNIYDNGGWVPLDVADSAGWTLPSTPVKGKPSSSTSNTTAPNGDSLTTTTTTTPTLNLGTTGNTAGNSTLTYNVTNNTTTTVTNNTTGQTSTSTDTEDPPITFQDSAMPDVPKLYTQKYPDGIAGVWRDNKPDISNTAFFQGVKSMFPTFGGGQCPVWRMSFNLGKAGNFGSGDLTVPCWIFQALGLVILATAAFTARKIIF